VNELRTELRQMKELLNVLFTIVVEQEGDDEEEYPGYPGTIGAEQPRFNN
jgi:hypothetical protein